jgi:NADPH-dependent 2,4-dienoyl-CoA reductase/sulfur reductase-like enzyme
VVRDLSSGEEGEEPYDHLLVATGARVAPPNLPGMESGGIHSPYSLEAAEVLRRELEEHRPRRAVIVGGGHIGLEFADALRRLDLDVTLVGRRSEPMRTLDPDMGALVARALEKMEVTLLLGEAVTGFESTGGHVREVVTEHRHVPADLVVMGAGVRPNSDLAREAGLPLGVFDAIKVDDHMRTPVEGIWAAGDCAETVQLVTGRPFWVSLATVAGKQGRVAGTNLGGGEATFPGTLGTAITKVGPVEVARTGLQEREIEELGIPFVTAKATSPTRSRYYPGAEPMTVKLLAEKGSGRLLGGQIVGGQGAGKRIDIVATALHGRMTVDQVTALDLAYSPPFSSAWDPVALAARELSAIG